MHTKSTRTILTMALLVFSLLASACQPLLIEQAPAPASDGPQLATAKASIQLSNQPGRAIVSARGNHFIVDSVPPIEGPNEELNPLDMLFGALATCGLFVAERAAQELDIPLTGAGATVEGDLDPSGVAGSGTDPRIQAIRVHMTLDGVDDAQTAALIENFVTRCPVYTTLSRSADIEITINDQAASAPMDGLATAKVAAQLSNQPGRAIVSARGNHFIIDSVPPLDGPNEERNPLDLLLGALGTCGTFIFERVAQEQGMPLTGLTFNVEADLDPSGVAGSGADPRIQAFRVNVQADGVDEAQAALMQEGFETRCPLFTTLVRAAPIEITVATGS